MSHNRQSMCLSAAGCLLVYAGLVVGAGLVCASPSEDVIIPSPQEYVLGVIARAAARSAIAVPVKCEEELMALVSEAISTKFKMDGPGIVVKNWWVLDMYLAHRMSSLFHALVSGPWADFRAELSDDQCKELNELVGKEVEKRMQSLEEVRRRLPCITTSEWFEKQCVKPGTFYTAEFCRRNLLSGCPSEDLEMDNVFYKGWVYAFDLPLYLRRFSKLVGERCEDVWCDSAVVDGIAELLCNHSFGAQKTWPPWACPQDETGMEGLTQGIADVLCGPLTVRYVDAVLRRVDLQPLWSLL